MSAPPPRSDSGGTSDRVRCAYCGANNFPTSPTCWQCGRPLRPLSVNAAPGPAVAPGAPSALPPASWSPQANGSILDKVNPSLAPKAAAALGMLFPWAALPIGITFLMLDDPRKVRLGWIAIGWSIAGTVLSTILFVLPLLGLLPFLRSMLAHPGGLPGGGGSAGMPSLGGSGL
jgi:hypothetical protein